MYRFLHLQKFKCLKQPYPTFTFNLIHSLPSTEPQLSMTQPNKETVMFQVSTCTNLQTLNQIYARIIRTHMLLFNPTPFYYNHLLGSDTRLGSPTICLRIFSLMSRTNVLPDCYTLTIVIKAVCLTFAVNLGREVHFLAIKLGLDSKEYRESGLISFYCKLREFTIAWKVFDDNPEYFELMQEAGVRPNRVTFVGMLSACRHGGKVQEGRKYLNMMRDVYNMEPELKHYGCMVDMLDGGVTVDMPLPLGPFHFVTSLRASFAHWTQQWIDIEAADTCRASEKKLLRDIGISDNVFWQIDLFVFQWEGF